MCEIDHWVCWVEMGDAKALAGIALAFSWLALSNTLRRDNPWRVRFRVFAGLVAAFTLVFHIGQMVLHV